MELIRAERFSVEACLISYRDFIFVFVLGLIVN